MWIDINKNNILRKEEKEMENKKLVVKGRNGSCGWKGCDFI